MKYFCKNCNAPAVKHTGRDGDGKQAVPPNMTLGTWHCSGECKGKVKVRREK